MAQVDVPEVPELPWHPHRRPGEREGMIVAVALTLLTMAAVGASALTRATVPALSLLQLGIVGCGIVLDGWMRGTCGRGLVGDGRVLLGLSSCAWLAGATLIALDRAVFLRVSLEGWFDDPLGYCLLLGASLPLSAVVWRAPVLGPLAWKLVPWISRSLALVGALLLALAALRSHRLPTPDDYVRSQPLLGTVADDSPRDGLASLFVAACSYRVHARPIRVRHDRVNGFYIVEPREGWLGACAATPDGQYRRLYRRLPQLRRAVSAPREWLAAAALGLVVFACVRRERRALALLAARDTWRRGVRLGEGRIELIGSGAALRVPSSPLASGAVVVVGDATPPVETYRAPPRYAEGAVLDGKTDQVEERLRRLVWARDAWLLLVLLVSITPLAVACGAGFGLPPVGR